MNVHQPGILFKSVLLCPLICINHCDCSYTDECDRPFAGNCATCDKPQVTDDMFEV